MVNRDPDRCAVADDDDGLLCQLFTHTDGQHAAMIDFDLSPERNKRRRSVAVYRMWGES